MDSSDFVRIAESLGFRFVRKTGPMGGLGFLCLDGGVYWVRGYESCHSSDDVLKLLSCYRGLYRKG